MELGMFKARKDPEKQFHQNSKHTLLQIQQIIIAETTLWYC